MEKFFYRVKKGDTLFTVSLKFSIPTSIIIDDNNLKKEIEEGDILYLSEPNGFSYVVKAGDTAESIADKFSVNPTELLLKNKTPYFFYGEIIVI